MVIWIHLVIILGMITLDVIWWVIAFRLTKRFSWRALISMFMAAEIAAASFDLMHRVGWEWAGLGYLPRSAIAAVYIWHFFGLGILACVGFGWACRRIWRRQRSVSAQETGPADPVAQPQPDSPVPREFTRREFIGACAGVAPPLFTVGLTGIGLGQLNHFRVRRFNLALPALPRALDGVTIAHVSDIHVGTWTCGRVLRDMVNTTNSLKADLVVVTGDLINYELSDLGGAIDLLKAMPGRYGLWTIEGNHDLFQNGMEFERRVKAAGVPLLLDDSAMAMVRGCPVQLLGLRWMDGHGRQRDQITALQVREVMKHRHPDAFPILLAHHPHAFDAAVQAGLPLTLSGHTHGGEFMLDHQIGVGPALFRYWSGLYTKKDSQIVVSNGVGNMFPLRINAPAEIVHLTLRCA